MKRRFFNMYLTTTISVMLVLLLVGMESVLLLSADHLIRQVRQNVAIDVVLREEADSLSIQALSNELERACYVHRYRYISAEEALEEHIAALGEDPTKFLGYNPLRASYEVCLKEPYSQPDSVRVLCEALSSIYAVERVIYQENVLTTLDRYVNRTMLLILIGTLLLLLIAWALIMNMIRLQIYSKRFLIHTMTLVGATSWHIRGPFVAKSVGIGVVAAAMASAILASAVTYIRLKWGLVLFPMTGQNVTILLVALFGTAILITGLASTTATGRYIRMKHSTLYEV